MLGNAFLTEVDGLVERQRKARAQAHKALQASIACLEQDIGRHVDARLDGILATQRRVEDECLALGKNQVMFHQKTIRWRAEYKRFRSEVDDLHKFEQWMQHTEANMLAICGKLEYVCHELNRGTATSQDAQLPPPSLFD
ncbi:hypothetical protein H310_12503 [Aphanomyces invadans]|uniref:Uncharacterized protein n=1 Tax=Aphanomyces invadans TaxID=157072 RepID=A0A024TIP2_9STRA|nr:hypothetical protein H310_12503 [Aphanomyces invadans]ETV93451.1 hypothetical protein H310_12503 [Aphanomyces invadans]|eukprot:XP_008877793.1 hypothetical protein H310_12503 [Aphanomyces invadans]